MSLSRPHYFQPSWIVPSTEHLTVDVCIYGGTSGGVAAAVTADRQGLTVALLQPGKHLGGMTTGGLGCTDYGRKYVIGGLSRTFYNECGQIYGKDEEWFFEPHVASAVYSRWLATSKVDVRLCQYVDTVEKVGARIVSATMLGGLKVSARIFIDASYEADLMQRAGVSYTVGRESNATYGETLNGIQVRNKHQFSHAVDPYVKAGDPTSGLLPQVQAEDLTKRIGEGDKRVQAYCFRMCMTDDPSIRIAWQKPDGYNTLEYELARRWFAGEKDQYNEQIHEGRPHTPSKFDIFPNLTSAGGHKTDTNNHGPISSDYIGTNHQWADGDYALRESIFQKHYTYQMGFYWTMANDPAIPQRYRDAYSQWGLPADEFQSTGHWPHQLYVREARRMVADYVITEHDCYKVSVAQDSVGMGSYTMDSHNCSRFVKDGRVVNDGDVQIPPTDPYPVSYKAVVPKRGEADNLFVPVCFSASHIAYGSARMEPVFMVLGESVALAARLAICHDIAVQDVNYAELRPLLVAAKQILELPATKE